MPRRKSEPVRSSAGIRCAIYTRKSSEEGLEQEFNSLDAQRHACAAYVLSQKHEGWELLPQLYDDGGISGATMERPALKRLIADIEAGKVDTVVVYKVDRLTRSLSDFARIVEVFDRNGVSFVSITQSFNTTTSMGRLTLNMLLSFAQFEREVTGERIRDKIAASKQKGMWMGGLAPLGYRVENRKLVVVDEEAETVRRIYTRYLDLGSVRSLKAELDYAGIVSKRRIDRFGRESGGKPFSRGALYLLLQNRIYRGEIIHRDKAWPGEHKPILDANLWGRVQELLQQNRIDRKIGADAGEPSLLAGLIRDGAGIRMVPTHATKMGTRYRYYASQNLLQQGRSGSQDGWRVPAADIEGIVEERLLAFLTDQHAVFGALEQVTSDPRERQRVTQITNDLAARWAALPVPRRRAHLQQIVASVIVHRDKVEIAVRSERLAHAADPEFRPASSPAENPVQPTILTVPARLRRAGMEMRLLVDAPAQGRRQEPNRSLLRLLARAQRLQSLALQGDGRSMGELAAEVGVTSSYFTRILRLSFLAPEITRVILDGRQPPELSAAKLARVHDLPVSWTLQIDALGIST